MTGTKRKSKKVLDEAAESQPHDAMFQLAFSVPKHAASELQLLLPQDVVRRIRWETMRLKSGTYTDAKLSKRHSDVLYEVELDGEPAFIYVL